MNKKDIQTVIDALKYACSDKQYKDAIAILTAALAEPRGYAGKMPPDQEDMDKAAHDLAPWLSAALDDPKVCDEYKSAINAWFNAAMPAALAEPSEATAWQLGHRFYTSLKDAEYAWRNDCAFLGTSYVPEPLFTHPASKPAPLPEMTDEDIISIAVRTQTAEGGLNGYILPVSFARAILAAAREKAK